MATARHILLTLLCALTLVLAPRPALAHGDQPSAKELADVYHGMLQSLQELQGLAAERSSDEAKRVRVEGAFTTALLRFLKLYELTVKAECPECNVAQVTRVSPVKLAAWKRYSFAILMGAHQLGVAIRDKAVDAGREAWRLGRTDVRDVPASFGWWLSHVGKLGIGATSEIFERYGYTYGIVWAVLTGAFEILEHVIVPIHMGCATFQAAYPLAAGAVRNIYRLGCNPMGDANYVKRLWNAFPGNYYEWKFWWRMSSFFQKAPFLVVEEEENERHFKRLLEDLAQTIERELGSRSYFQDALAYFERLGLADNGDWTPPRLLDDLDVVFGDTATRAQKVWIAQQHTEGLRVLLEPLRLAVRGQIDTLTFVQYFRLKRLVGALGRLVDEYAANLLSAAMASRMTNRPAKRKAAAWVLGEIVELFRREPFAKLLEGKFPIAPGWLASFAQLFRGDDAVAELRREIKRVRREQFRLRGGAVPEDEIPACSAWLTGGEIALATPRQTSQIVQNFDTGQNPL